jgi:hypothetical protein
MHSFQPTTAKNKAWLGKDGPPGCHSTLKHHSLDPHGGLEMVPQQLIWWYGWIPLEIWLLGVVRKCIAFSQLQPKTKHGLAKMRHQ